jgi:hypothetical protein
MMARSKRRAMRANWSPAPARVVFNVNGSAEISPRLCGETLDCGFGSRGLLPFDYVGGNVAAVSDSIINKGDAGQVRLQRGGDRSSIIPNHIVVFGDA